MSNTNDLFGELSVKEESREGGQSDKGRVLYSYRMAWEGL